MRFPTGEGKTIFALSSSSAERAPGDLAFETQQLGENMHTAEVASRFESERYRLEELLSRRLGARIRQLRLIFQDAGVVLRGRSDTYYSKQIAQHTVMEFSDVPIAANEIEVK